MKNKMLQGWNFMRILRMILGVAIIVQSVILEDIMFAIAGILLTAMAFFNIGCCGTSNCNITNKAGELKKETSYEEVV